jgi:hypothetical protein
MLQRSFYVLLRRTERKPDFGNRQKESIYRIGLAEGLASGQVERVAME